MTGRHFVFTSLAVSAICLLASQVGAAPGTLAQSWKTPGGWLTELRVHPDGAKVCSSGKVSQDPHQFVVSFVRSGSEAIVLMVDQQQPPAAGASGEMTFHQSGETVGKVRVQAEGPAWASVDPNGPQTKSLMSKLSDQPLTIEVAGRKYEADFAGYADAMAQLSKCVSAAN